MPPSQDTGIDLPALDPAQAQQGSSSPATSPAVGGDFGMPVPSDLPAQAEDNDLIEKEWVDKVKQIIAATQNDPYQQQVEISRMKADYIRKRYGRDTKAAS